MKSKFNLLIVLTVWGAIGRE